MRRCYRPRLLRQVPSRPWEHGVTASKTDVCGTVAWMKRQVTLCPIVVDRGGIWRCVVRI
jgi:hypothetical protein